MSIRCDSNYVQQFFFTLLFLLFAIYQPAHADHIHLSAEEKAFIAQNPVIKVGAEFDWFPIDYIENNQHTGLASDYLELVSEQTGLKFEIISGVSWNDLLTLFKTKQLDLLPAVYWSPDRVKEILFTSPYISLRNHTFVRSNQEFAIKQLSDLNGKKLAVVHGVSYENWLHESYPLIDIIPVATTQEAIDALLTDQVDALIENTALVSYLLKQQKVKDIASAFPIEFGINEVHMGTQPDMPLLRDIINKVLDSLSADEKKVYAKRWVSIAAPLQPDISKLTFNDIEQQYLDNKGALKVCIDPDWMPFEGLSNGKHTGMTAEYMQYFSDQLGIPITLHPTASWADALNAAKQRHCDIVAAVTDTPERREYLNFTHPYIEGAHALATQNDTWFFSDLAELEGKTIGAVRGYAPVSYLAENYPKINVREFDNLAQGIDSVSNGEILGFIDVVPTLSYYIQNNYSGGLKISGKFDYKYQMGMGARNDEPVLLSILNKTIATMPSQLHTQIKSEWINVRYEQAVDYKLLWQIVIGFVALLILLLMRNRRMSIHRMEMAQKNRELADMNNELAKQTEAAQHMARHDQLTGLPNRSQLMEYLSNAIQRARRNQQKVAILFIDLDRFKYINDSLGHDIGDELLCAISNTLAQRVRSTDMLARVGGDEFIVVLDTLNDDYSPSIIAQDIIGSLATAFSVRNHELRVGTSIGISIFPDDSEDIHTLIRHADMAMYQAKDMGRNRFRYFTTSLSDKTENRLKLENALRDALEQNQFSLVYQPIIDLELGKVSSAEALIRWHHPDMGLITPDEFIPLIEENGLIHEIGLWGLRSACQQFNHWQQQGLGIENIAVNVSSIQFQRSNLLENFQQVLNEENVAAQSIGLEITENHLMDQTEHNIAFLNGLKQAGHKISVDDFGIGYSSMSYMKRLPINTIKIDRSFISDIPEDQNDMQITHAIVALSNSLGYTTVAEGVEELDQLHFLQDIGCRYLQGYLFSKPLAAKDFEQQIDVLNQRLVELLQQQA